VDESTEIADFGCGPGLYTEKLAERGATVTGIDFSENSIRHLGCSGIVTGVAKLTNGR
jgi:2-polyprenyl-3-methyl-5-hydroxy-6-metoxy-1,4-benzoquinol methylase